MKTESVTLSDELKVGNEERRKITPRHLPRSPGKMEMRGMGKKWVWVRCGNLQFCFEHVNEKPSIRHSSKDAV